MLLNRDGFQTEDWFGPKFKSGLRHGDRFGPRYGDGRRYGHGDGDEDGDGIGGGENMSDDVPREDLRLLCLRWQVSDHLEINLTINTKTK